MSFYAFIKHSNLVIFKNKIKFLENVNKMNKKKNLYYIYFIRIILDLNFFFKTLLIMVHFFLITFFYGNILLVVDIKKNLIIFSRKICFFRNVTTNNIFEISFSFKLKTVLIKFFNEFKKVKIVGNFSRAGKYFIRLNYLFLVIKFSNLLTIDINKKKIKRIKNFRTHIFQIIFLNKIDLLLISSVKSIFCYSLIYNETWIIYKFSSALLCNRFRIKYNKRNKLNKFCIYFQSGHFFLNQLQKYFFTTFIKRIYKEAISSIIILKNNFMITISFLNNIKKWEFNILFNKILFRKKIICNFNDILHFKIIKGPVKLIGVDYRSTIIGFNYASMRSFFLDFNDKKTTFLFNYYKTIKKTIKKTINNVLFINKTIFRWNSLVISYKNSKYMNLWSLEVHKKRTYSLYKEIIFKKLDNFIIKTVDISEDGNFIFLGVKPNMILKYEKLQQTRRE
uniref:Uncharacterized protein n=1 Tax=Lotharella vacuolata TaxID=74820 RepID=A0A0H5BQR5_9EUKA|nr:hypothetical protein [Lotharella vacuolata]